MLALLTLLLQFFQPDAPYPDVDRIERNAAPGHVAAIDAAVLMTDPAGERPWLRDELLRVCWRESKCGRFGRVYYHQADGWAGERAYAAAVKRGWLDPKTCPAHRLTPWRKPSAFSTRGGWGMMAAGHLRRVGTCVGPEAFDRPEMAALAAADLMVTCRRWHPTEHEWLPCTCQDRVRRWVGSGNWDALSHAQRRAKAARQCGPQPLLTPPQLAEDAYASALQFASDFVSRMRPYLGAFT